MTISSQAREILAQELERDGYHLQAELVRNPIDGALHLPALRAIDSALHSPERAGMERAARIARDARRGFDLSDLWVCGFNCACDIIDAAIRAEAALAAQRGDAR